MTQFIGYGAFQGILEQVESAVIAELRNTSASPPARISLVPGAIAWDECDQCGLLALAVSRIYLSDNFPMESTGMVPAPGAFLVAECVVQLIRCAPVPQGNDLAPSVAALEASAKTVLDDAQAVMCSTINRLQDLQDNYQIVDFLVRHQSFMGPEGACVGSELLFVVGINR
jgi:hypothetical protein